jgi:hypothetical protein
LNAGSVPPRRAFVGAARYRVGDAPTTGDSPLIEQ